MSMDFYPGHYAGDGCHFLDQGHFMPYSAELRTTLAEHLKREFGSHLSGSYNFEAHAEQIIDLVLDWLVKDSPEAINNAHRSHISYVRHLMTGGEANQKGVTIESYGSADG